VAQDYAKKKKGAASRKRSGSSGTSNWVWMLAGVVVGAFIMFLAYLSGLSPQKIQVPVIPTSPRTDNPSTATQEKPTFEFYDSLKNNEIIPPGEKPATPAPPVVAGTPPKETAAVTAPPAAVVAVNKPTYYLQVASFPKAADADAMKAKLTLEGLDTNVQSFNKKGDTWYRVMVGPFNDPNKIAQAREKLAQHKLTPIVLQKKPGN
jgi:cell division protein FtsN